MARHIGEKQAKRKPDAAPRRPVAGNAILLRRGSGSAALGLVTGAAALSS
jgi:hypothetical protein